MPFHFACSTGPQLIVRLLRLLQASGVSLDPNICRWGPGAGDAAAAVAVPTAAGSASSSRHRWQWLLEAFEARRLRASVEAFPIERGLEPPPFGFEARSGDSNGGSNTGDASGTPSATRKSDRRQNQRRKTKRRESFELGDEGGRRLTTADLSSRYHGNANSISNTTPGNEDGPGNGRGDRGHDKTERGKDDRDTGNTGEDDSNDSSSQGISDESSEDDAENGSGASSVDERDSESDGDYRDDPDPELELELPLAGMETSAAMKAAAIAASTARAAEVYDPCFVLPLVEWGLRVAGAPAQSVSHCCVCCVDLYRRRRTENIPYEASGWSWGSLSHTVKVLRSSSRKGDFLPRGSFRGIEKQL